MRDWTRRGILGALASASALVLAGCTRAIARGPSTAPPADPPQPLVDAHCHLFNITDLPVASFAQTVLLKDYPGPEGPTWRQRRLADALRAIESILARRTPTAAEEARPLREQSFVAEQASQALSAADERALREEEMKAEAADPGRSPPRRPGADISAEGPGQCERGRGPELSVRSVSTWLRNLRGSRSALARELAREQGTGGYAPRLLCPALVDYSNWLGQELKSPLPDQVEMGGLLARDLSLPPIHGYVAIDPLRCGLVRTGRRPIDGNWDPLALARRALVDHGYAGVKLYPPMGFRASGNGAAQQQYPPRAVAQFGSAANLGAELDRSLEDIWALCLELDAPIMAHAGNSNAAGEDYGRRADPAYWLDVVRRHPELRIMLGHFGGFGTFSAGQPGLCVDGEVPFEASWEGAIGNFVHTNPDSRLFADISYLSEIFDRRSRDRAREGMLKYLALDRGGRHLVFGSDWIMLGVERQYPRPPGYVRRVVDFLAECRLSREEISGVLYGNAIRFLGLDSPSKARTRLLRFYSAHGLPADRLPA
jgi:predicted TIM-barrel fold metal-dependent hydrolase